MTPVTGTIDATGQTSLGVAVSGKVCSWLIHFEDNSFTGSITIKGAAADSTHPLVALAYKDMATGDNATAAITTGALVLVDGSGLNITLDCTSASAGSLSFTARPMIG